MTLDRDPICVRCKIRPSTVADHIIPKPVGPDELENLQGLCVPCHNRKTHSDERGGGVDRSR